MGVLQTLLEKKDELIKASTPKARVSKPSSNNTIDAVLTDDDEVERLSQYIDAKNLKKVIGIRAAIKHGVEKIGVGSPKDCDFFLSLRTGATKKAKKYAASILSKKWSAKNLTDKILTRSGKEVVGKAVSKNIYIKQVHVTYKTGKRIGQSITYLQARNKLTGRIVKLSTATRMIK
jgi:hypothetical protein